MVKKISQNIIIGKNIGISIRELNKVVDPRFWVYRHLRTFGARRHWRILGSMHEREVGSGFFMGGKKRYFGSGRQEIKKNRENREQLRKKNLESFW